MLRIRIDADPARLPRQADLDALFARARRARVLASGVEDGKAQGGPVVAEADGADLASLHEALRIREGGEPLHCMCRGDLAIELFGTLGRIATLGAHHGVSLRLDDWSADADLEDGERLMVWLAEHGAPEFLETYRRAAERAAELNRVRQRWLAAMPPAIAPFLSTLEKDGLPAYGDAAYRPALAALLADAGSPEAAAVELLGWLGAGAGEWGQHPAYEGVALELLERCGYEGVLAAIPQAARSPQALAGAARFVAVSTGPRERKERLQRLDDEIRQALLRRTAELGSEQNLARLRAALEPPADASLPPGFALVGRAAQRVQALAADGEHVFIVDGTRLARFEPDRSEPIVLVDLQAPSPLAAGHGWVLAQRGGEVIRLPCTGGEPFPIGRFSGRSSAWQLTAEHLYAIVESGQGDERNAAVERLPLSGGPPATVVEPQRGGAWDLCVHGEVCTWVRSRRERRILRGRVRRASVERHRGGRVEELARFDMNGQQMIRLAQASDGTLWWTDALEQVAVCAGEGRSKRIALPAQPKLVAAGLERAWVLLDEDRELSLVEMTEEGIVARRRLGRARAPAWLSMAGERVYASLDDRVVRVDGR